MRQAFFVMGPESSGTRMLTRAFVSVGVFGDDGEVQRLDDMQFEGRPERIVFRRSIPHDGEWPPVGDLCREMAAAGFDVWPVVILRDREITARSQVKAGHSRSVEEARQKVDKAVILIYAELACVESQPVMQVAYESFVAHERVRVDIFASLGLSGPVGMEFYNGNEKYLRPANGGECGGT